MYVVLKLVHVLAVVLFLGNITTGVFWKAIADASGNVSIMRHTIAGIIRGDRLFTVPGVVVLLIAGLATAGVGHLSILGTGWILWSLILFVIAGLAFGPVARLQRLLLDALDMSDQRAAFEAYRNLSRRWSIWAAVALATPFVALVLMIMKPALPAFHR